MKKALVEKKVYCEKKKNGPSTRRCRPKKLGEIAVKTAETEDGRVGTEGMLR